jgi:hypothetical protein
LKTFEVTGRMEVDFCITIEASSAEEATRCIEEDMERDMLLANAMYDRVEVDVVNRVEDDE